MNITPKQTKKETRDPFSDEWLYDFEEQYLQTMKPTVFSDLSFYVFRIFTLLIFWYAAVYAYTHRLLFGIDLLSFFMVYVTVSFCAIYQTIDTIRMIFADKRRYFFYEKMKKEHEERRQVKKSKKSNLL